MAEGLLISGRMLKDHMLGALLEGLDGAIESSDTPPPCSSEPSGGLDGASPKVHLCGGNGNKHTCNQRGARASYLRDSPG